jgi:hypothetical protein
MRSGASLRWVGPALLVFAAAGTALAQSTTGAPGAGATPAQVGFERRVQLSPQEESTQADAIVARVEQVAQGIRRQLDKARLARDVVKSLCLSDKLSQVDVAARSARDRQAALQAAVQRGDAELANHEFTILSVLKQRVDQLSSEANQCIGEEVAFIGQTTVVTEIDPNLPGVDEEPTPPPPPIIVTPPPPVTQIRLP